MDARALAGCALVAGCAGPLRVHVVQVQPVEPLGCVVVLPFANLTPVDGAGLVIAQELTSALMAQGHTAVVSPTEALHLLARLQVPLVEPTDSAMARRYGDLLASDTVLWGAVTELSASTNPSGQWVVGWIAELRDTRKDRTVWASTVVYVPEGVLLSVPQPRDALLRRTADAAVTHLFDAGGRGRASACKPSATPVDPRLVHEVQEVIRRAR